MGIMERYDTIMEAYADDPYMPNYIEKRGSFFKNYGEKICSENISRARIVSTYDKREAAVRLEELKEDKAVALDMAMTAARQLNRLAKAKDMALFFEGDELNVAELKSFVDQAKDAFYTEREDARTLSLKDEIAKACSRGGTVSGMDERDR